MKNILLVLLFAFSVPALASETKAIGHTQHHTSQPALASETKAAVPVPMKAPVNTDGYAEKTPEGTLKAIKQALLKIMPHVKGDEWVNGAMNLNVGSAQYNKLWTDRMNDDFDQPVGYPEAMAAGKKLWETPFANGKTMASCFPNGGKGAANMYPKVDPVSGKVITFDLALNKCRTDNGESALDPNDMKTMGTLSIVARKLSDGERINMVVKTDAELAAFNRGKEIFYGRVGELENACAHCHIQKAGSTARTEELSPVIGQTAHWPVFRADKSTDGVMVITLHKRYEGCQNSTRVDKKEQIKPGSDASNDLEYFHTYLSNGLPLSSGVFRK